MLYKCSRSATVISRNYCTCAQIDRANYNELLQIYPLFNEAIKFYINTYDDPLKIFFDMSLNQVDFFTNLPRQIKNEWIFTMKQRQLEKGSLLYRIDTFSDEMYVLQSGLVEITHQMDNGDEFVIERLMRGSVVNHNSFLMNDGIDTDAKCRKSVSKWRAETGI